MRRRTVPATDLSLPVIGFGTGDNAGLMVAGEPEDQVTAVARALELGIDYFDTAPDYGLGRAEENLGRALKELGANGIICTKVEITPADLDDVATAVVSAVDGSLRRLGVDHLDVLQIHNAPASTRVLHTERWGALEVGDFLAPGGALSGMRRLREAGKVGVFGFTCAHADPGPVRELLDTGAFGIVNIWYNLLNPSAGGPVPPGLTVDRDYDDIIAAAGRSGVGVAVFRPLAGGALTGQATGEAGRHPLAGGLITRDPRPFERERGRAANLAAALGIDGSDLTKLAYRFVLDHPHVTTVLGGCSDLVQLEELAAMADAPPLTGGEHDLIRGVWSEDFELHQEVR